MFSEEALKRVQRKVEPTPVIPTVESVTERRKRSRSDPENDSDDDNEVSASPDRPIANAHPSINQHIQEADRTAFVGNLPVSMDSKAVAALFHPFGRVESVRLRSVPVEGMKVADAGNQKLVKKLCVSKGKLGEQKGSLNAYVVFEDRASVEAALALNNTVQGGRHIRVDTATPTLFPPKQSLFLGNVPFLADEEELRAFFVEKLECGEDGVRGVRIVRDAETLVGKGIAYVLLADRELVHTALALPKPVKYQDKHVLRISPCSKAKGVQKTPDGDKRPMKRRHVISEPGRVKPEPMQKKDNALRRLRLKKVETKKKFLENRKKRGKKPMNKK